MLQTPTKQVGYGCNSLINKTSNLSVQLVNLPVWRTCHHSSWVLPFKVLMYGCSAAMKRQLCFTQFALHMFCSFVKMFPHLGRFWSRFPLLNTFRHYSSSLSSSSTAATSSSSAEPSFLFYTTLWCANCAF